MVRCEGVVKEFHAGVCFRAVNEVTLHIKKGEFVAVVGKSGSGKSTLLNLIGLIDTPTDGEIVIDGAGTKDLKEVQMAEIRNKKIGYIFQSFYLEPSYQVYKNVEMPLLIANMPAKQRKSRIGECLEKVGVYDKRNALTNTLSGGEKQRVCIARALANSPELILADEPCGNLDTENTANVMRILKGLQQEGKTILLVTHNPEEAAYAERVITLKDGKVVNHEA